MSFLFIIFLILIWYFIGISGFVYWWGYRKDGCLNSGTVLLCLLFIWILGVFIWILGYIRYKKGKL